MGTLVIEGKVPLRGTVAVSGAKNAALPIIVATALTDKPCTLRNVPRIEDVRIMLDIWTALGGSAQWLDDELHLDGAGLCRWEVPQALGSKIRYSLLLLGALLARFGKARVPAPGGCQLGERKFDLHLVGLEHLGARIWMDSGYICAEAGQLHGAEVDLYFPTKSGTDNILLAASRAEGGTTIRNPCRYPETADLAAFLNAMGAQIEGAGSDRIMVQGVRRLHGARHTIMPDRIEAATYMVAAAITGGAIRMSKAVAEHLQVPMEKLAEAGVRFQTSGDTLETTVEGDLRPIDVTGGPDPLINTDIIPLLTVLANFARGESRFRDLSFEDRYTYAADFNAMGAALRLEPADFKYPGGQPGQCAVVQGPRPLHGARVQALDLRGGVTLALAGLAAEGITEVTRAEHVDRGYERLEQKLTALGARIKRSP